MPIYASTPHGFDEEGIQSPLFHVSPLGMNFRHQSFNRRWGPPILRLQPRPSYP